MSTRPTYAFDLSAYHAPWLMKPLDEWSIVGLNHYSVNGERQLFVAMTKDGHCVQEEGPEDQYLWNRLWHKAIAQAAMALLILVMLPVLAHAQRSAQNDSATLQLVAACDRGVYDACDLAGGHWYYLKNGIWTRDDGVVGKPPAVITGTCTVVAASESEYWKHFNDVSPEPVKAGLQIGQSQASLRDCKIPLNIAIKWRAKSYSDCYAAIGLSDECYRRADGAFEAKAAQLHMFEDCDKEVESAEKRFEIEEKDNSFPLGKVIVGGLRRLFRKK